MKNNNLDKFESMMQDALNSHQESFAPSSWNALEKNLPKVKKPFYKSPWFWGAAVVVCVTIPVVLSTINIVEEENQTLVKEQLEEQILPKNTVDINTDVISSNSLTNTTKIEPIENAIIGEGLSVNKPYSNSTNEKPTIQDKIKPNTSETKAQPNGLTETTKEENVMPNGNIDSGLGHALGGHFEISKPLAFFNILSKEICEGSAIELIAQKQDDVDYLWSFGDGNYSKMPNPKHTYQKPGSYIVSLIVRSSLDNSILSKAADELVIVNPNPKVDFSYELKDNHGIPITSFINLTDKGLKWNWNTGDGNAYADKDPDHLYYRKGKYNVTLTVENEYNCVNTISKSVDIKEDYNLLAPNSFTPNGDGINDNFIPEALRVMDVQFTMTIISINDGIIFESNSVSNPWNGYNQRTGSLCAEGTYKWVVSFVNSKGKTEQFTGAVLLLK